jgi:flagellar biogenesis protein FliO
MNLLASSSTTGMVVMACLGLVFLIVWGFGKYKESQAAKKSQELRNIFSSVNTPQKKNP